MNESLYQIALERLLQSHYLVALTGAGISTESGVPAFRGSDGLWSRFDPETYANIRNFHSNPKQSWDFFLHLYEILSDAQPNAAHIALAQLEKTGKLQCTITQNVDGLHQKAGQEKVIEIHGSFRVLICTVCARKINPKGMLFDSEDLPPICDCGGVLKPDAILFGESIPSDNYFAALRHIRASDTLLLIGTSGLVHPVNELPEMAVNHGARLIEINLVPTILTTTSDTLFLQGSAGTILKRFSNDLKDLQDDNLDNE
jgi:NAD-dependent deacetylase